jgi:hypothetical protein
MSIYIAEIGDSNKTSPQIVRSPEAYLGQVVEFHSSAVFTHLCGIHTESTLADGAKIRRQWNKTAPVPSCALCINSSNQRLYRRRQHSAL